MIRSVLGTYGFSGMILVSGATWIFAHLLSWGHLYPCVARYRGSTGAVGRAVVMTVGGRRGQGSFPCVLGAEASYASGCVPTSGRP